MTKLINDFLNDIHLGDCWDVMDKMPEKSVDLVFADVPYNMQLQNDLKRPDGSLVDAVNDDWDKFTDFKEYDKFTEKWLNSAKRVMKDNASIFIMGTYANIYRIGTILQDNGWWILNDIHWIKINPLPNMRGTRFCNSVETIIWAVKNKNVKKYTFNYHNLKASNDDKQMRADWYIPLCTGKERLKTEDGTKAHSTQKPEALLHTIIVAATNRNDIILDPFSGTATTAAVAKKLGRNYICIDNNTDYVKLGKDRLDKITPFDIQDIANPSIVNPSQRKVPFLTLVTNGYINPGEKLYLHTKSGKLTKHETIVLEDGNLLNGLKRLSIHQMAKDLLFSECNGWNVWAKLDDFGNMIFLDTLRIKYLEDKELK